MKEFLSHMDLPRNLLTRLAYQTPEECFNAQ